MCGYSDSLAVLCGGGSTQLLDRSCSFLGSMISIYLGFVSRGFRLEASCLFRGYGVDLCEIKALVFKLRRFLFQSDLAVVG